MGEWIYPFQGRGSSGSHGVNFLWTEYNIYIMDNHLFALWCWSQHYQGQEGVDLFHVDAHYDSDLICDLEVQACPEDIHNLDIEAYLEIENPLPFTPLSQEDEDDSLYHFLFHWSNYLSFFMHRYHHRLNSIFFCTQKRGRPPNSEWNAIELEFDGLLERLRCSQIRSAIINIDFDYFVDMRQDSVSGDTCYFLAGQDRLELLFAEVQRLNSLGRLLVLTICLSPECCGTWSLSEEILAIAGNILGLDFRLPSL